MSTNFCPYAPFGGGGGSTVKVILKKNGSVIAGQTLQVKTVEDLLQVTGVCNILLNDNDTIEVFVEPQGASPRTYKTVKEGCALSITKLRVLE